MSWKWACMVAFCLFAAGTVAQAATPEEQALVDWVVRNGGTVNVEIGLINNNHRGLIAPRQFSKGDLLMAVPDKLGFNHIFDNKDIDKDGYRQHRSAVHLLLDMQNASSPHQVWWRVNPPASDFQCTAHFFPREYCGLLQSRLLDMYACDTPWKTVIFVGANEAKLHEFGVDPNQIAYAITLITTRYFGYRNISRFLPVIDMANHRNLCPNRHFDVEPCPESPEQSCVMFKAGEELQPGDEVCLNYGGMWQDRAMLQYGYLQHQDPPQLIGVDRHDMVTDGAIWKNNNAFTKAIPSFSASTVAGYQKEIARLADILQMVETLDKAAALWPRARTDPNGKCLDMVMKFREHRKAALRVEIARLQSLADELSNSPAAMAPPSDSSSSTGIPGRSGPSAFWLHNAHINGVTSNLLDDCPGVANEAAGTCSIAAGSQL